MTEVRIATRASRLAMTQARAVGTWLRAVDPGVRVRLVEVTTSGDQDRTTDVTALTEMGAFVRAVQSAVLENEADIAVHSCKDLPTAGPDGLAQWFPERESPHDALCGATLDGLASGATVGTGSPRRTEQLLALRPDLRIVPIRGNVETRLGLVGDQVDAVVLAEAGLRRLGLGSAVTHRFDIASMTPAPAQGALCVEAREGSEVGAVLDSIDDPDVRRVIGAERRLLEVTGAGCRSALGGYAELGGDGLTMTGFVADGDGRRRATVEAPDTEELVSMMCGELGL